jgi:hypothetical protein
MILGSMIPERAKAFVLPVAILAALEIWARATHLQSDSLAPPSAIAAALAEAFRDGSILTATRDWMGWDIGCCCRRGRSGRRICSRASSCSA